MSTFHPPASRMRVILQKARTEVQNPLASTAPPEVSTSASVGTSSAAARADHTHALSGDMAVVKTQTATITAADFNALGAVETGDVNVGNAFPANSNLLGIAIDGPGLQNNANPGITYLDVLLDEGYLSAQLQIDPTNGGTPPVFPMSGGQGDKSAGVVAGPHLSMFAGYPVGGKQLKVRARANGADMTNITQGSVTLTAFYI